MTSLSRRSFLLSATAVGAAAALGVGAPRAHAVETSKVFADAATAYQVPAALLAAISYGQTRWSDHAGRPSMGLGYGPMHLVDGARIAELRAEQGKEPLHGVDTLARASKASGIAVEQLRSSATHNVAGAAAMLAAQQRRLGGTVGADTDPADWFEAVALTSGLGNPQSQLSFADTVMSDLAAGMTVSDGGTTFRVAPQAVGNTDKGRGSMMSRVKGSQKPAAGPVDGPASLGIEWVPAPYVNFSDDPTDYGNHDLGYRPKYPALTHVITTTPSAATTSRSSSSRTRPTSPGTTRSARPTATSPSTSTRRTWAGMRATGG